ncbi:MAG: hypothetical protein V9H69_10615 [Anaerolineae bacterium]
MKLKRLARSWGEEVVIGEGARVARVYASAKKVTVDLSQVRDETWDRFVKVQAKYPGCTKIELPAGCGCGGHHPLLAGLADRPLCSLVGAGACHCGGVR